MDAEQESLDLIEPTQDHVETENIEMSEEIQFDSEKTETEPQNDEGNDPESLDVIEPSQETEESNTTDQDETKKPGRGRPSKAEMERRAKEKVENGEIEEEKDSTTTKPEGEEKLFKFPLGTVKRIIKMDPDVNVISKDSIFLITKALEMFVESLSIEAYSYTAAAKKKTLSKQDVEKAIDAVDALAFLDGALDD